MVSSFYHYNRCLKKRMFNKLNEAVVLNKMNIDKAKDKIK